MELGGSKRYHSIIMRSTPHGIQIHSLLSRSSPSILASFKNYLKNETNKTVDERTIAVPCNSQGFAAGKVKEENLMADAAALNQVQVFD